MSASSEINLKQTLRKLEYPLCAKEALNKIYDLICGGRIPSIKHMDLALDLMSEFIFYETDRRGNKRSQQISSISELQLLEILFEYFNNLPNEAARNTVFLSLFSGTTAAIRLGILSKLVSIAVGIPSASILVSASTWMQQLGNMSGNSCKLADVIVYDYFYIVPNFMDRLKKLPNIAPQFTANFLTAMAENFFTGKNQQFPSTLLLETVTLWITENSWLCIAAQQRQTALPPGAIAMEATTPIAGLLRWCILAPIFQQTSELYSNLHMAILNSILEIPNVNPPKAICAQHLSLPIPHITNYATSLKNVEIDLDVILNDSKLQLSLDRFAQAVQVALSVNAIYGYIDDLFNQLQQLPFNKLLKIILSTHKQIK